MFYQVAAIASCALNFPACWDCWSARKELARNNMSHDQDLEGAGISPGGVEVALPDSISPVCLKA